MSEQIARVVLVTAALTFVAVDLVLLVLHHMIDPWVPLGGAAILIAIALLERGRYRPRIDPRGAEWKPTGERFVDPTSGEMTAVYYNARTNERDYRPL